MTRSHLCTAVSTGVTTCLTGHFVGKTTTNFICYLFYMNRFGFFGLLTVCVFVCQSVSLSDCQSLNLSLCLSCLSPSFVRLCQYVCFSVCLSQCFRLSAWSACLLICCHVICCACLTANLLVSLLLQSPEY